jgi:hypothetical protein
VKEAPSTCGVEGGGGRFQGILRVCRDVRSLEERRNIICSGSCEDATPAGNQNIHILRTCLVLRAWRSGSVAVSEGT